MIGRFFSTLWSFGKKETEKMKKALRVIFFATLVGVMPILAFRPSIQICVWITLTPLIVSAYKFFSIRRFIAADITGEILEALHMKVDDSEEPEKPTSIYDNKFIRLYLLVISGMFIAQVGLFLLLPLYVNYTIGGLTTLIIILMVSAVMALSGFTSFAKAYMAMVGLACSLYALGVMFVIFPQISYYIPFSKVSLVPVSSAKLIRDTDELRKEQIRKINDAKLSEAFRWQESHPGQQLPQEFLEVQEAAGKNVTVEQLRQQKASEAKATAEKTTDIQRKIELDKKAGELQKNDPPKPIQVQGKYSYGEDPGTDLDPGKYEVVAIGSDFKYQNPDGKRRPIGPEGLIGKEVSTQSDLFVPSAPFGSLIVKIGDGPWQHIGKGAQITVHRSAWVRFTRNLQKDPFTDYKGNVGGDVIEIKRVGQLSTAFF